MVELRRKIVLIECETFEVTHLDVKKGLAYQIVKRGKDFHLEDFVTFKGHKFSVASLVGQN